MAINDNKIQEIIGDFIESDSVSATVGKFLLMTIALGGIVFVGALAPGILSTTRRSKRYKKYSKKQIENAAYNLKKRKLIEIVNEKDNKIKVRLTNKGKERVKGICFEKLSIKKPAKWDGKWRVLIFDIPTKPKIYNQARNALREKIKELGFYQMQKSVWAYPYECEDEILLVAEIFRVQEFIEILRVDKILHDDLLRKKLNLHPKNNN